MHRGRIVSPGWQIDFVERVWKCKPLQFTPELTREFTFAGLSAQAVRSHHTHQVVLGQFRATIMRGTCQ